MNSIVARTALFKAPAVRGSIQHLDSAGTVEVPSSGELSFFRRVMDDAPCPILIVGGSAEGQDVVYANEAFQRLSGRTAFELHAHDWTSVFACIPRESDPSTLQVAMYEGEEARATLCMRQKNGSYVWVSAVASPVRSGDGAVTHHILVFHDLTEERRSRQELERRAYHDPLTGLANRNLLNDRFEQALARARRHDSTFAVVLLDMNGFKLINDRFGHDVGDELLKCVGARLRDCVREEDTVARIGGDEFVLLLERQSPESTAAMVCRISETVEQSMLLKGCHITPASCIGVGRFPVDGGDFETLLKAADVGLYRSKASRVLADMRQC